MAAVVRAGQAGWPPVALMVSLVAERAGRESQSSGRMSDVETHPALTRMAQ
jgi:hypothetical protein